MAAVSILLSTYPDDVIRDATDPTSGIPAKSKWMPSVAEVKEYCDGLMRPRIEAEARRQRITKQLQEREEGETKRK